MGHYFALKSPISLPLSVPLGGIQGLIGGREISADTPPSGSSRGGTSPRWHTVEEGSWNAPCGRGNKGIEKVQVLTFSSSLIHRGGPG